VHRPEPYGLAFLGDPGALVVVRLTSLQVRFNSSKSSRRIRTRTSCRGPPCSSVLSVGVVHRPARAQGPRSGGRLQSSHFAGGHSSDWRRRDRPELEPGSQPFHVTFALAGQGLLQSPMGHRRPGSMRWPEMHALRVDALALRVLPGGECPAAQKQLATSSPPSRQSRAAAVSWRQLAAAACSYAAVSW